MSGIFSASSAVSYNRKLKCVCATSILSHITVIRQYQSKRRVRKDIQISGSSATLSHSLTPVFTHFLTSPRVLHVNRVCRWAEEVLTSPVAPGPTAHLHKERGGRAART